MVYPWNFIFPKGFWRKRNTSKQYGSGLDVNNDNKEKGTSSRSTMEAISLEMKQQELDGRWDIIDMNS